MIYTTANNPYAMPKSSVVNPIFIVLSTPNEVIGIENTNNASIFVFENGIYHLIVHTYHKD